MTFLRIFSVLSSIFAIFLISGCSELQLGAHYGKKLAGSSEPSKGSYKVGKPYLIQGKQYVPEVNYDYTESGIASWYGPGFDGKKTANGERFYQNELTAAHRTLPLPSIVRVTNLENGKTLVVRVNDRGPFSRGRIIDLSKRAADLLGYRGRGTARVRVEVLEQESRKIAQAAMQGMDTRGVEVAMNAPNYKSGYQKASYTPPAKSAKAQHSLTTAYNQTIAGHSKNGLFYPDPVVSKREVKPTKLYVQAGSFTSQKNATALAEKLSSIGKTSVDQALVNGKQYYRVRILASSVDVADSLLSKVIRSGQEKALIVVE